MTLDVSTQEAAALRDLVEARLFNLTTEIRHTDSPRLRQELRDLREVLRTLRPRLESTAA